MKQIVGVIGAGTMGRGIVQLFAQAGHRVCLYDAAAGAVEVGIENVNAMLDKQQSKGRIDNAQQVKDNIVACTEVSELADCEIIIEAIIENVEIKRSVFKALEKVVKPSAILASNTSSLLIADIASACEYPERIAGLHFFNPVPLMKVAEVISSVRTAPEVVITLQQFVEHAGHRAVVAQDQPGFLVNHAGRGLYTEGLRLLEENVTDQSGVDAVLREAAGFRMGPFELLDLTGLDVSGKVMESIYEQFYQEPFFRPSALVQTRIAAGLYGRKTKEGWYEYKDGKKIDEPTVTSAVPIQGQTVWVDPRSDKAPELRKLLKKAGAAVLSSDVRASAACLIVIQPWGVDASQYCTDHGLDATRCVAIDPLPKLSLRRTVMLTPVTEPSYQELAYSLFSKDGVGVTLINDSAGFIVQRVLAMVINIASNIAQRRIAKVADIEDAVKLGLAYPQGPLSWGDDIGGEKILAILNGMYRVTQDPRYRPSPWLRRRVQLGVSLMTDAAYESMPHKHN